VVSVTSMCERRDVAAVPPKTSPHGFRASCRGSDAERRVP
jgi:hypothetical protein